MLNQPAWRRTPIARERKLANELRTPDVADGYALQQDGVTISIAGGVWAGTSESRTTYDADRRATLRRAIPGAHPGRRTVVTRQGRTP
jgi:hypothetical protein